ncbi:MFS transporter [Nocardia amikacinitolerans]|uniref:MFS transporter n=1 Tax=Nocardia amikacinitolerans TaxID=756689 RepID=UPI0020A30C3B|nr:MFS transporter [Nocardia amikacinitolerans]MCP2292635.1 putative arabinose efflux permease, MFS family [Nocardia amikacinitolerans]
MGISVDKASAASESDGIDSRLSVLLALACGISVANVYYAQPLLDGIGADLGIGSGQLGLVTTLTQAGYLLGLVLLVPLGDLLDRRRLITALAAVASAGSVVIAISGGAVVFLAACALVGLVSVVVQVVVAYAAVLSAPARRGAVVGTVTSGVVIGILLARTVSGLVAEVAGWRAVFAVSAALMLTLTFALARALPADTAARQRISYGDLITSVVRLTIREPVFRARSLIALFMFAAFGAVWGSMALPLAAAPWRLSEAEIGLFGIVGAAGAVGAARAGRWADRGLGQWISAGALAVLALSWLFIWGAPHSLLLLAIGVAALDFAGQALHVTNQNLIVAIDPAASSRLIGSYMVFYSLGTGGGAIAATALYSAAGWDAVCLLGAILSGMAALVWIGDRRRRQPTTDPLTSRAAACQEGRGRCSGPLV